VPLARYFMVVGSALMVLLLIAGWTLPQPPPSFSGRPEIIDRATIRIKSARKWPDKVVLDTSQPTFSPTSIVLAPAQQSVGLPPDEMTDQTSVDALAKPNPAAPPTDARDQPSRARSRTAGAPSSKPVARARYRNELPLLSAASYTSPLHLPRSHERARTQRFASLEGPGAQWQFPSKPVTNDQYCFGCARYPGEHDRRTVR
jgi:hypothetical protein